MVKPKNYPDVMFLREIDIPKNREYLGKSKWFLTQLPGLLFPWDYHKGFFHQTSGLFPDSSPPSFNWDPAGIVGWRGTIFPNKQISMFTNLFKRKFGGRGPSQMCVLQIIISYGTKQWSRICRPWQQHSHRIHVWYIYAPIWLIMVNVGKYTSPMDPMGFWDQNVGIPIASIRWGSNFENAVGVSGRGRKN